jgi:3-dehydroquinate synthetase
MIRDRASAKTERLSDTVIDVSLKERSYQIVVGKHLIGSAGRSIAAAVPGARCVVVSDANIAALYLEPLAESLEREKIYIGQAIVAPGETSKSFAVLAGLSERLLEIGVERGDCVIALGGGVVGDLAGFAASVLRRGVRFVQIPTSLLAQVDSSVGGKTGIDTKQGKNLIGAFHQPSLVLADTSVLSTLPAREFRSGYAEIAKYGLLGDAAFFTWLESHWQAVFAGDSDDRLKAIATSIRAKAMSSRSPGPGPCSISATLSATRSKLSPVIRSGCCMASPSPSACGSPSISPSSRDFARKKMPLASRNT